MLQVVVAIDNVISNNLTEPVVFIFTPFQQHINGDLLQGGVDFGERRPLRMNRIPTMIVLLDLRFNCNHIHAVFTHDAFTHVTATHSMHAHG